MKLTWLNVDSTFVVKKFGGDFETNNKRSFLRQFRPH